MLTDFHTYINSVPQQKKISVSKPLEDLIIVIDTREQIPYTFNGMHTTRRSLKTGDYSIYGHEDQIAVERKSLPDFIHSITHERTRFFKEVARLSNINHACIVVEANWSEIVQEQDYEVATCKNKTNRNSIIGSVTAIQFHYKVPVLFLGDRPHIVVWIESFFTRFWKAHHAINN